MRCKLRESISIGLILCKCFKIVWHWLGKNASKRIFFLSFSFWWVGLRFQGARAFGLLLTNPIPNSFVSTGVSNTAVQPGLPVQRSRCLLRILCCTAGMNHSLFVVSHDESPGMWDATSDIDLVSEVLFIREFKRVRQARKFSGGKILLWWGEGQWFLGLALSCFLLNKVPLVFVSHGGRLQCRDKKCQIAFMHILGQW